MCVDLLPGFKGFLPWPVGLQNFSGLALRNGSSRPCWLHPMLEILDKSVCSCVPRLLVHQPFFRPLWAEPSPLVSMRLLASVTSRDGGDHILSSSSSAEKDDIWGLKTNQREGFTACVPDSGVCTAVVGLRVTLVYNRAGYAAGAGPCDRGCLGAVWGAQMGDLGPVAEIWRGRSLFRASVVLAPRRNGTCAAPDFASHAFLCFPEPVPQSGRQLYRVS